jgi:shikimate kinase
MGAGKTTIGRRLAKALQKSFFDSDREIEERTGASVSLIFEIEGETGFRARERRMIDELTQFKDVVLATGGGAVLDPDNRACLKQRGFVIYLRAPVERLLARTHLDRGRPLLQTADPAQRIRELLTEREPFYREVADVVIDTGHQTVRQVVEEIIQIWKQG